MANIPATLPTHAEAPRSPTTLSNPQSEILAACTKQLHSTMETILARLQRLPSDLGNVIDDSCHITVDCLDRAITSKTVFQSLLAHDLLSIDSIGIGKASRGGHFLLAETCFWTALCLVGFQCGEIVGDWSLVDSVLEMMLDRFNSFFLVFCVLPFFVHTLLRKSQWTFAFSFLMGVLLSYSYSQPTKVNTPPLFICPYLIGWTSCCNAYYNRAAPSRIFFLLVCYAIPCMFYMTYAYIVLGISSVAASWVFAVSAAAMIDLQLKIGRLARRWATESLEQWSSTCVFIVVHTMYRLIVVYTGTIASIEQSLEEKWIRGTNTRV